MGKTKKESKPAAAPKAGKSSEGIKAGRVTKPVESAKNVAKEAAKKVEKTSKKNKKKEPTPEPSSESEVEDDTSASSASSEDDSDGGAEVKAAPKTNGVTKAVAKDDDSEDDSDDSSDDEEVAAPKTNGAAKAAVEDDDDDDSDSSDSDEDVAPKVNGNGAAALDASDDSDSDDSGSDAEVGAKAADDEDDDDESSDGSESEEEVVKTEAPVNKKRKAEDTTDPTPKKVKVNGELKDASANLFVGNLSFNIDEEWLTREFEEYGQLKAVRVITDRDSGRSKGYGYVEFEEMADAITALESKNETEVDGRNVRVDFSLPRPERGAGQTPQQRSSERAERYGDAPREPSATLFVGNLAFAADETTVSGTFEEFGSIQGVRLITDRDTGNFKGYGYVEMGSVEEATAAFEGLQGAEIAGRAIRLDYASAKPTNDSPGGRGGFGGRGGGRGFGGDRGGRGRGGFGDRGGRGGRGGFDRGRGRGRGDSRGRGSFNRGGFGDFSGKKTTF